MASTGLVAVWLAVLLCMSAPSVEARRKLQLVRNVGPLLSKFQPEPQTLGGGEVRMGRRGLVLLQQDPYDAGFGSGSPEPLTAQITEITTDPTVPAAQQPYTATVVVLGAFPGQKIQIQVDGSDGFRLTTPSCTVSDVGFPGGAGYCRQTIPGSPWAGAVDTLTATITSLDGEVFVSKKMEVGPIGPKVPK